MRIEKTIDKMYPIKFNDTYGEGAYLHRDIVMDDREWDKFIAELQKIRTEIKKGAWQTSPFVLYYNCQGGNTEGDNPRQALMGSGFESRVRTLTNHFLKKK